MNTVSTSTPTTTTQDTVKWKVEDVKKWVCSLESGLFAKFVDCFSFTAGDALLQINSDNQLVTMGVPGAAAVPLLTHIRALHSGSQAPQQVGMFQPKEKYWICDGPVVSSLHWQVSFDQLCLPSIRNAVAQRKFLFVHGHTRAGKTSHRLKLAEELYHSGFIVYALQFDESWLTFNNTPDTFWSRVLRELSIESQPNLMHSVEGLSQHLKQLPSTVKVVFLFDEFQIVLRFEDSIRQGFISTLKTYRDQHEPNNRTIPLYRVASCICFGTFKIMTMSDSQNSYSPFHVNEAIQMSAANLDLLRNTLSSYNATLPTNINRSVLESIVSLSNGHLGIFSLLGQILHNKMGSKGLRTYSDWVQILSSKDLFSQLRWNKPYQQVVNALQQNDLALYKFLRRTGILFDASGSYNLPDSNEVFELIDVGVLEKDIVGHYIWTSPIIRNFIVQYCEALIPTVDLPEPVLTNGELDILATIQKIVPLINVKSIIGLNLNTLPREAAFHAELYRLLATLFRICPALQTYQIFFEGHVGGGSRKRFDLLIVNEKKYVVELKIRAHTQTTLTKAVLQVAGYGAVINAHKCFVIDFSDHNPVPNLYSTIRTSARSGNVMIEEDDFDYEFAPSNTSPFLDVHVVHFVYGQDWSNLLNCV